MNKKVYQKPSMTSHEVEFNQLLSGSVNSIGGNASMNYGGGKSDVARGRDYGDWDEE